ncbi:hypothetical protein R6Q59_033316 [Mikania micrantha]
MVFGMIIFSCAQGTEPRDKGDDAANTSACGGSVCVAGLSQVFREFFGKEVYLLDLKWKMDWSTIDIGLWVVRWFHLRSLKKITRVFRAPSATSPPSRRYEPINVLIKHLKHLRQISLILLLFASSLFHTSNEHAVDRSVQDIKVDGVAGERGLDALEILENWISGSKIMLPVSTEETESSFPTGLENSDMPNPWYTNPSSDLLEKLTAVGWPSWLAAVSGEALNGWLPRRIDTFKNLGKIGEGNHSIVYKARDIPTGRVVALKKIKCDHSDPETIKTMAMEIVTLRRLDHPNVIKLEGIVTSPRSQTLYLVFEYMDHDLATLSASNATQFTEPQVKHYMHQLFSGLKYCHDHQVLHRDLKGSDLLVSNNGVLKIADFGSASFYGLIHEQPMTNFVATYWYRAPELLLGATEYGVGVDLWSAGCISAGLLANRPILAGHTEAEQLEKIYALCGSPPDEYWKTYKFPLETIYKPQLQFRRCLTETFKDFPPASLSLLDVLLSVDPAKRQNAASALKSKFLSEIS